MNYEGLTTPGPKDTAMLTASTVRYGHLGGIITLEITLLSVPCRMILALRSIMSRIARYLDPL
jgi:hypothetical protein